MVQVETDGAGEPFGAHAGVQTRSARLISVGALRSGAGARAPACPLCVGLFVCSSSSSSSHHVVLGSWSFLCVIVGFTPRSVSKMHCELLDWGEKTPVEETLVQFSRV